MKNMFQQLRVSGVIGIFFLFSHTILDVYAEDSSYLQKTLQAIRQHKGETGVPPNDIDFFRLIIQLQIPLTSEEREQVKLELEKLQSPVISKNDLIKLYESKKKVIQNLEQKYQYTSQDFDTQGNRIAHDEFVIRQLFSGNKIYSEKENIDNDLKKITTHSIFSFDGDVERHVFELDSNSPYASIKRFDNRELYFELGNVLSVVMLTDSRNDLNSDVAIGYDFIQLLRSDGIVFEKTEIFDNRQCVVVSNGMFRIFLDIVGDFSVVHVECYDLEYMVSFPKLIVSHFYKDAERNLYRLKDYGNGIWFPEESQLFFYDKHEKIVRKEIVFYENISLNTKILDSFFRDVIPENAMVTDSINNITYIYSDHASINSLIKETVKSKRIFIYRYISIISGLALIFIALTMKYLAYIKAKRERKNKTAVEEETK
ncbi:MAG: hypothetical protein LBE13_09975 [Bacteroidales bacterium]|nr:hypothetical protein [Bacteroidales bacterium]